MGFLMIIRRRLTRSRRIKRSRHVPRLGHDTGAGTVLALAIIAFCLVAGVVGVGLGELAAARAHLASAADLAALAAASHSLDGSRSACEAASGAAKRNGAALLRCQVQGSDVVVAVRAPAPRIVAAMARMANAQAPTLQAQARAGPPRATD